MGGRCANKQRPEALIEWVGSSLEGLRDLPAAARQDITYKLQQIQFGSDPDDCRATPGVGAGCRDIASEQLACPP